jgi:hypothetical protein
MSFYSIPGVNMQAMPSGFEQVTVTSGAGGIGLTSTKFRKVTVPTSQGQGGAQAIQTVIAEQCLITINTNPVRWTIDGTTPTSTVGHPGAAGDIIMLDGINAIQNFKAIATGSNSTLDVTYFSN